MARLLGAHMPTAGGLDKAVRNGAAIGCTAIQVFTSSPRQWKGSPVTEEKAALFKRACAETGIGAHVVSHDTYLTNLAAPDDEIRHKSLLSLAEELIRCDALGIPCAVSHIAAHKGQGVDLGLRRAAEGVQAVLANSPESVSLLAETTAGQGSDLNSRFEEIAALLDLCHGHPRLGVCLDTCHIFSAGYDIRTEEAYEATMAEFDRIVGFSRLKAVHANDSKFPFGSHRDRHEHLGEGEIGPTAFQRLVRDPRTEDVPIVIETPDEETHHEINVKRLWEWASG